MVLGRQTFPVCPGPKTNVRGDRSKCKLSKTLIVLIVFSFLGRKREQGPGTKFSQCSGSSQVICSLILFYIKVSTTHLGRENKFMSTKSFDQWDNETN